MSYFRQWRLQGEYEDFHGYAIATYKKHQAHPIRGASSSRQHSTFSGSWG